ncbi:ABC transporter permease [Pseudonocardia sp. DLS-67]
MLAGTAGLVRLVLRHDRVPIGVWVLVVAGIVIGSMAATESTYPTEQARQDRYDQILAVPMFMFFQSRAYDTSVGALTAQQAFGGATIAAALGAVLIMVRHTRGEEQAGRRELLGSTVVGRHASLTAPLVVTLGAGLVIAAIAALGLVGAGLPIAGSIALGLVAGAAAWVAAGLAAVTAQLTQQPVVAVAGAFGAFAGLHYVRGIAHLGGDELAWLAWLTPNGWLEFLRPFAGNSWPTLLPVTALTAALIWLAGTLSSRRDLGAALLTPRPGPATATPGLRDPLRLAWRQHRTTLLTWAAGLFGIGAGIGSVGSRAMTEYAQTEWVRAWASAMRLDDPADAFLVYTVFVFVFATTAHAVTAVLRLRTEEVSGLAEAILSTTQSRNRWIAGHLSVALAAPVLLQASLGLGLGTGRGDPSHALGITLPLVPAIWVVVGVTVAAFGLTPRWAPAVGWFTVVVGIAGELAVKAGLPEALYRATSPFAHVSPYYQPTSATYLLLTLVAGALVAIGAVTLRRRDITTV